MPDPQQPQGCSHPEPGPGLMGSKFHPDFSPLQCQDLLSQTSSPLSQNDSCTARSADLLLPPGDTGRRRHDSLHDPAAPSRVERFRLQVGQERGLQTGVPSFLWARQCLLSPTTVPKPCWAGTGNGKDTSLLAFPSQLQPAACVSRPAPKSLDAITP